MARSIVSKLYFTLVVLVAISLWLPLSTGWLSYSLKPHNLTVGGAKFEIEIAEDHTQRLKGLSGRDELCATCAMLFIFENDLFHGIWMKDMKIDIDVIWLDSSLSVVDVVSGLTPKTYPRVFYPNKPARYVLEINAGSAKENQIQIGTQAKFIR